MNRSHADKDPTDGKYVRLEYTCHRAGKIKATGIGANPYQKYYANECNCHVYMRYKKRGFGCSR
jgi:hypothetical protein